jgi:SAM-dependent methyltransferase
VRLDVIADRIAQTRAGVLARRRFLLRDSGQFWERRYAAGGNSGQGSYGRAADWKAEVVNRWVREHDVTSVVDLGCGDGHQLSLAEYPRYLGLDRSPTAIRRCMARFADDRSKSFLYLEPSLLSDPAGWLRADMALSLEVIFHLVEDATFEDYMRLLFSSAERFVVICSNDVDGGERSPHERYRAFTEWVARECPGWALHERLDPPASVPLLSSFFLYARVRSLATDNTSDDAAAATAP